MTLPLSTHVLLDILQFSTRFELEEKRLLCSASNSLILQHPNAFQQRYKFKGLWIGDSYLAPVGTSPRRWVDLLAFRHCCSDNEEINVMALSMSGKHFLRGAPGFAQLFIGLYFSDSTSLTLYLSLRNRLTPATAFDLLHMLHHLNGCSFEEITTRPLTYLPSVLSPFATLHCQRLFALCQRHGFSEVNGLPRLFQLSATPIAFNPGVVEVPMSSSLVREIIKQLLTQPSKLPFSVELKIYPSDLIRFERIMGYFHTSEMPCTLSKVEIDLSNNHCRLKRLRTWPFLPFTHMEATSGSQEEGRLLYGRINQATRKKYRVVVELKGKLAERINIEL